MFRRRLFSGMRRWYSQLADVSEELTAITALMETVSSSRTLSVPTRLHGAAYQKTGIFILIAVRT
jgi:hypothetical protein